MKRLETVALILGISADIACILIALFYFKVF